MRQAPSAVKLLQQANFAAPGRSKGSDGICGDAAHQKRPSDHNRGKSGYCHAGDVTKDMKHGIYPFAILDAIRKSRDSRAKMGIADRQIWTAKGRPWRKAYTWGRYFGPNPHTKHGHLSIIDTKEACEDISDWAGFGGSEDMLAVNTTVKGHFSQGNADWAMGLLRSYGLNPFQVPDAPGGEKSPVVNAPGGSLTRAQSIGRVLRGRDMRAFFYDADSDKWTKVT